MIHAWCVRLCITVRAVDHHWRSVVNATALPAEDPMPPASNLQTATHPCTPVASQGLKHHEQHVSLTRKQDIVHLCATMYTPLSPQYPETHPAIINRIAVRCLNVPKRMCKLRRRCWICRVVFLRGVIRVQISNVCLDS